MSWEELADKVLVLEEENAALREKLARLVEAAEKHLDNQNAVTFLALSEAVAAAKEVEHEKMETKSISATK
jgi:hypothetical protein